MHVVWQREEKLLLRPLGLQSEPKRGEEAERETPGRGVHGGNERGPGGF